MVTEVAALPAARKPLPWYRRPGFLRSIAPVLLLVGWQVASQTGLLSPRILPAPSVVFEAGWGVFQSGQLGDALLVSGQRALIGFLLGASVGIGFGILAGLSRLGEYTVDPPLQMLRTIPLFGLIPLIFIWFGNR
jgi:sulfonate transport system permease protein